MKISIGEVVQRAEGLRSSEMKYNENLEKAKKKREEILAYQEELNKQLNSLHTRLDVLSYEDDYIDLELDSDYYLDNDFKRIDNSSEISDIKDEIRAIEELLFEAERDDLLIQSEILDLESELKIVMDLENEMYEEIEDSAQITNRNIAMMGGVTGAYAEVSQGAVTSFQKNLQQLSTAAQILGKNLSVGSNANGGSGFGGDLRSGNTNQNFYQRANQTFSKRNGGNPNVSKMSSMGSSPSGGRSTRLRGVDYNYNEDISSNVEQNKKMGGMGKLTNQKVNGTYGTEIQSHIIGNKESRANIIFELKTRNKELDKELDKINLVIEKYKEALLSCGMNSGNTMDKILESERIKLEAELLRNIHGDFSKTVGEFDVKKIAENAIRRGTDKYASFTPKPKCLKSTEHGFSVQEIDNKTLEVYNNPVETIGLYFIKKQGNSHYDIEGDCGLCQCGNMLVLAGLLDLVTEDIILSKALHLKCFEDLSLFSADTGERGSTTSAMREEFMEKYGLQTYQQPVCQDSEESITALYNAVITGHGVIVSVDAGRFFGDSSMAGKGHAVSIVSATKDGSVFICSDTGKGELRLISAEELAKSLTGRPANITTNIIR